MKKVNMLTRRKGQLTMFIITGILIVVIVFFLVYSVRVSSIRKLESEARRVASTAISNAAVKYLGDECISRGLREGIVKLGEQGGWFAEGQAGYIGGPPNLDNVSYLIYQENYPDSWPCKENEVCRYVIPNKGPFFSHSTVPSLQQIERQLGKYIAETTKDCVNLTQLFGNTKMDYSVGDVKIKEMVFGVNSISAKVDYPIEVKTGQKIPVILIQHLEGNVEGIKFKQIYSVVRESVEKEVSDISYNMKEKLPDALSQYGLHDIQFLHETKTNGTIFRITDLSSRIEGIHDYYPFQFAIKNRPPVLSYISRYPGKTYDYLAIEGEQVTITPNAIDPDDEERMTRTVGTIPTTAGNYILPVTARDNSGLTDAQNVKILIDYKLNPVLNLSNGFDDVDNRYASVEDPYYLHAYPANKTLDQDAVYSYKWLTKDNPNLISNKSYTSILFKQPGQVVNILLLMALNYGNYSQTKDVWGAVDVKQCLPHETHTCCKSDFSIVKADEKVVCYEKETNYYCKDKKRLWLDAIPRYCDGTRGNICNGSWGESYTRDSGLCGINKEEGCSGIAGECEKLLPYTTRLDKGWCYGATGCEKFCKDSLFADREIVDANNNNKIDSGDACGCKSEYNSRKCDSNFDNKWDGACSGGKCI